MATKDFWWTVIKIIVYTGIGVLLGIALDGAFKQAVKAQEMRTTPIKTVFHDSCGCHKTIDFKTINNSTCLQKHCADTIDAKMLQAWLNDEIKKNAQ